MGRSHVSMCAEPPIQQTIHSETFRMNCRKAILVTRRQSGPSYGRERLIAGPTLVPLENLEISERMEVI
jgi:hypothetical protein